MLRAGLLAGLAEQGFVGFDARSHSKIERGDQEISDGGVLLVRRSRADAGNEAI
jgi:hypothetical protein